MRVPKGWWINASFVSTKAPRKADIECLPVTSSCKAFVPVVRYGRTLKRSGQRECDQCSDSPYIHTFANEAELWLWKYFQIQEKKRHLGKCYQNLVWYLVQIKVLGYISYSLYGCALDYTYHHTSPCAFCSQVASMVTKSKVQYS